MKGSVDKIEDIKTRPFGVIDDENSEMAEDPNTKPDDDDTEATQGNITEESEHSKSNHSMQSNLGPGLNAAELASSLSKLQAEKAQNTDTKRAHLKVQNVAETGQSAGVKTGQPAGVKIITTEATKLDLQVGDLKIN